MIILKILLIVLVICILSIILVLGLYKLFFHKIQIAQNEIAKCVIKIEMVRYYLTSNRYQVEYDLGSDNVKHINNLFNRLIYLINNDKDSYFKGRFYTDKNINKRMHLFHTMIESFRSKKYKKRFRHYNHLVISLIDLISLEKNYRLKDKEVNLVYINLKTKLLKDLVELIELVG